MRAEFSNKAGSLIPGQYVTIQVKEGAPKIMPVVPQVAVLAGKDGRYVLMVEHGIATPRAITIGPMVGKGWAVKSGLKVGEKIIVSGLQKVRPGMPVTVAPPQNREEKK